MGASARDFTLEDEFALILTGHATCNHCHMVIKVSDGYATESTGFMCCNCIADYQEFKSRVQAEVEC